MTDTGTVAGACWVEIVGIVVQRSRRSEFVMRVSCERMVMIICSSKYASTAQVDLITVYRQVLIFLYVENPDFLGESDSMREQ